jgi:cation transport ATPase
MPVTKRAGDTVIGATINGTGSLRVRAAKVTAIRPIDGVTDTDLLTLVAAEADSEHPLAAAIVGGARERGLTLPAATGFDSITGKGVRATVNGHQVLVGTATFDTVRGGPGRARGHRGGLVQATKVRTAATRAASPCLASVNSMPVLGSVYSSLSMPA